ncbi:MAG: hypothetical protein GY853_02300 [PVC group bacterium]|nr:hypothetical protein [PVC group bacterium]
MSFTAFSYETTIAASEMNDNFIHVAQGNLFPRGGSVLEETNGVYDLGSDSYRWLNTKFNNVHLSGDLDDCWNLIADVILSATASSVEITELNGDVDEIYWIIAKLISNSTGTDYLYLNINNDSSNNYGFQYLIADGASIGAARNETQSAIILTGGGSYGSYGFNETYVYAKSNNERLFLINMFREGGETYIEQLRNYGYIWNNTSDTLTSMQFTVGDYMATNTNIQIWTKR